MRVYLARVPSGTGGWSSVVVWTGGGQRIARLRSGSNPISFDTNDDVVRLKITSSGVAPTDVEFDNTGRAAVIGIFGDPALKGVAEDYKRRQNGTPFFMAAVEQFDSDEEARENLSQIRARKPVRKLRDHFYSAFLIALTFTIGILMNNIGLVVLASVGILLIAVRWIHTSRTSRPKPVVHVELGTGTDDAQPLD